jgi:hypothetical protein
MSSKMVLRMSLAISIMLIGGHRAGHADVFRQIDDGNL